LRFSLGIPVFFPRQILLIKPSKICSTGWFYSQLLNDLFHLNGMCYQPLMPSRPVL